MFPSPENELPGVEVRPAADQSWPDLLERAAQLARGMPEMRVGNVYRVAEESPERRRVAEVWVAEGPDGRTDHELALVVMTPPVSTASCTGRPLTWQGVCFVLASYSFAPTGPWREEPREGRPWFAMVGGGDYVD
jgi:hypothetical protein